MPTKLDKITAKTASEICARYEIDQALVRHDLSPGEFLDLLIQKELFVDAVRFLAHAIPAPDAVLWACRCAREQPVPPPQSAALEAAEKWAKAPDDNTARAAFEAGRAELSTAAGCTAMAAFFGGRNIAPEGAPPVPPPPDVCPKMVTGSIILSAVSIEPENAPAHYRHFLDLATVV